MKWVRSTLLSVAMLALAATNVRAQAAGAADKPTIFVCGDSTSKFNSSETMDNLPGKGKNGSPTAGWGTPIGMYFDSAKVHVNNVGHAGTSSMSYYNGDWPRVLPQIKTGDYVLIVFGINDGTTPNGIGDEVVERPAGGRRGGRGATTAPAADAPAPAMQQIHTYGWYMKKMATDAASKGAHVVFLTVTTRNIWTNPKVKFNDGTPVGDLPADYNAKDDRIERGTGGGKYTQWTKEVAAQLHLPVFDLTNFCADRYEAMGREAVNALYSDHNHTYLPGATVVAESIVSGLKALKNSPFTPLLSQKGRDLPTADAKFVSDNLQ